MKEKTKERNYSRECRQALLKLAKDAKKNHLNVIQTQDLVVAMINTPDTGMSYALGKYRILPSVIDNELKDFVLVEKIETIDKFANCRQQYEFVTEKAKRKLEQIEEPISKKKIDIFGDLVISEQVADAFDYVDELHKYNNPEDYIETYFFLIYFANNQNTNAHQLIQRAYCIAGSDGYSDTIKELFDMGMSHHYRFRYCDGSKRMHDEEKEWENSRFSNKIKDPNYLLLDDFTTDITKKAKQGLLPSVIGRDREIREMELALTRRDKNNVVLIGPGGVGKSAIVEGLAIKIANHEIPSLDGMRILQFNLAEYFSELGIGFSDEKLLRLISEMKRERNAILFIDEIHQLRIAKSMTDTLKPLMARGDFRIIGATTPFEWFNAFSNDQAFELSLIHI